MRIARGRQRCVAALAAMTIYTNTLENRPVLDDGWVIFDNSLIKSLKNVPEIFRQPYNAATPSWNNAGVYRPVTTLSYAINYAIGGPSVAGYHLFNISLHVICCLLVLELGGLLWNAARVQGGATLATETEPHPAAGPLIGALLFAVHPVHVEAATAMVGRAELLAALGSLGCLYLTCTRSRASWRYPGAFAALALGTLSKENAAATPLLFCLIAVALPRAAGLEARPLPTSPQGRRALRHAGILVAGMACAIGLYFVLRPGAGVGVPPGSQWFGGQPRRVVFNTMTRVVAEYLRLLVFPHPLGLDFAYSSKIPFTPTFTLACLGDTLVWTSVLALGLASLRRVPLAALGILWVFVALLPVLNIIPAGVLMGERLLYLPSVGFCIAAATGAGLLLDHLGQEPRLVRLRPTVAAAVVLAGFALASKSLIRNAEWHDALTLYEAELGKAPGNAVLNNNLAVEYTTRGKLDLARERLEVVLRTAPWFWRADVNMGIVAHKLHDDSAAIAWLERARQMAPSESSPYFFTALVLADQGKLAQAVDYLARAETVAPQDRWTHFYRGRYLDSLGRKAEAQAELKRAAELDPALR